MQSIRATLPDDLREWLRKMAGLREVSESSIVRQALREMQRRDGKENGK
jgi:hypothetical protein